MADNVDALLAKYAPAPGPASTLPPPSAAPQLDPRGRPYDPRFAPEPEPAPVPDRLGQHAAAFERDKAAMVKQAADLATSTHGAGMSALGGLVSGGTAGFAAPIMAAVNHPVEAARSALGHKSLTDVVEGGNAYQRDRDMYQRALDEDRANHPVAFGGGELAGGVLSAAPLPGARTVAGRLAQAGGLAAAGSVGEDVSHGRDVNLGRAAVAGGIGTALGGLGELAAKGIGAVVGRRAGAKTAEEAAVNDTLRDFLGESRPKDRRQAAGIFNAELAKSGPGAATIRPRDVILGDAFKGMREAPEGPFALAAKGDREGAAEALERINQHLNAEKAGNYAAADAVAKPAVGGPVNDLETTIAKLEGEHGTKATVKALSEARDGLMHTWSTTDAAALRQRLERDLGRYAGSPAGAELEKAVKAIPESGLLTRADVNAALGEGLSDPAVRRAVLDSGWSFRPEVQRPLSELRQAVTRAQDNAVDTLGSIAETEHHKLRAAIAKDLNQSLEKHLDKVAMTSPEAAANVTRIRNSDAVQSATLALKGGLDEAQGRAATEGIGLSKRTGDVARHVVGGEQAVTALLEGLSGNLPGAAKHAAGAVLATTAPGAIAGVKRAANRAAAEAAYNNRNAVLRKLAGAAGHAAGAAGEAYGGPARVTGAALAGKRLGGPGAQLLGMDQESE